MSPTDADALPAAQRLERIAGEHRRRHLRQEPDLEEMRYAPRLPCASILTAQYSEVVSDVVANDDGIAQIGLELRRNIRKMRRFLDLRVRDPVDLESRIRNGDAGIDQLLERRTDGDVLAVDLDAGNLHDACCSGVEASRFGVERDGLQGHKR